MPMDQMVNDARSQVVCSIVHFAADFQDILATGQPALLLQFPPKGGPADTEVLGGRSAVALK